MKFYRKEQIKYNHLKIVLKWNIAPLLLFSFPQSKCHAILFLQLDHGDDTDTHTVAQSHSNADWELIVTEMQLYFSAARNNQTSDVMQLHPFIHTSAD